MAFDYKKFLVENQLTPTSRLKERFFQEEEEFSTTPDKGSKAALASRGKAEKLQKLTAQKDEILAKYKKGELSLDQYKSQIGNIPQQIKQLRADLDAELNPDTEDQGETSDAAPLPAGSQEEEPVQQDTPEDMGDEEENSGEDAWNSLKELYLK
jgi:hypothetical protein